MTEQTENQPEAEPTAPESYERKFERLEEILRRLDDTETPIDELAEDVKEGARLIKDLDHKLRRVEGEVIDALGKLDRPDGEHQNRSEYQPDQ